MSGFFKFFLVPFALLSVATFVVLGPRGGVSRRNPIEIFNDMDHQQKLRPQTEYNLFPDGRSSRLPVSGTVARGSAWQDSPANTGRRPGPADVTNFVAVIPVTVNEKLVDRGQQRYGIYCLPCHGALGDGNGVTKKLGMSVVASLHDKRIVGLPDGELFHVISNGRNLMGGYAATIDPQDRWAVVAYVRLLQRSRLATTDEVPADKRAPLIK